MNASKPSHQSKGLGGNIGCNASRPWCFENVVSHIQLVGCQPGETTKFVNCGQSHPWSGEQGKENKRRKSGSAPPPPRCSFGEKKINKVTWDASTFPCRRYAGLLLIKAN